MKKCGRNSTLKIRGAYGPALRTISKCHIFKKILADRKKKVTACIVMIPCTCRKFG